MFTFLMETVLGAVTGYVTNDVAIRQLFRRGGLVEREREQFTDMLVHMLCHDILNRETLEKIFEHPQIEALFHRFAVALVEEALPNALAGKRFVDGALGQEVYRAFYQRVDETCWPDFRWQEEIFADHIDKFIKSDDFLQAVHNGLRKLASKTPNDLGLWPLVRNQIMGHPLLNDGERIPWLKTHEDLFLFHFLKFSKRLQAHELWLDIPISHWIDIDPEMLCDAILRILTDEHTENVLKKTWYKLWQDLEWREHFLEAVHQHTHEMVGLHYQDILETLFVGIQDDRIQFEEMFMRSLDAVLNGTAFREPAKKGLQRWFDNDGKGAWLSRIFANQLQEKNQRLVCGFIAKAVSDKLIRQLQNAWSDEPVEIFVKWLKNDGGEALRPLIRQLIAENLNKTPAELFKREIDGERWGKIIWQGILKMAADDCWEEIIKARIAIWMAQPLRRNLLSDDRQRQILRQIETLPVQLRLETIRDFLRQHRPDSKNVLHHLGKQVFYMSLIDGVRFVMNQTPMHDGLESTLAKDMSAHVLNILPNQLNILARTRLDGMSHEEIRELSLSVLGREMRPLSWLGGIVGGLAGGVSGAVMGASGMGGGDHLNHDAIMPMMTYFASRSGMYGAVGYGTNILAVKGLFKPHRSVLGFQGLLPKNQKRFAETMRRISYEYIINENHWQSIQKELVNHDLGANQLRLNQVAIHWQDYFRSMEADVSQQLRDMTLVPYVEMLDMRELASFLLKEAEEHGLIKRIFVLGMNAFVDVILSAYLDQLERERHQPHKAADRRVIGMQTLFPLQDRLLKKMTEMSVDEWWGWTRCVVDRLYFPVSKDSMFYRVIRQILRPMYEQLPTLIEQQARFLAKIISKEIRQDFSISMDMMFRLAGGSIYIRKAIEHFAKKELPKYLDTQQAMYEKLLQTLCQQQLGGMSIADVGLIPYRESIYHLKDMFIRKRKIASGLEESAAFMQANILPIVMRHVRWDIIQMVLTEKMRPEKLDNRGSMIDRWIWCQIRRYEGEGIGKIAEWLEEVLSMDLVQPLLNIPLGDIIHETYLPDMFKCAVKVPENREDTLEIALAERLDELLIEIWPSLGTLFHEYGQELIRELALPDVIYEQICALDSAHMEEVVCQIADPYFRYVERMGWFGAVVAFPATWLALWLQ